MVQRLRQVQNQNPLGGALRTMQTLSNIQGQRERINLAREELDFRKDNAKAAAAASAQQAEISARNAATAGMNALGQFMGKGYSPTIEAAAMEGMFALNGQDISINEADVDPAAALGRQVLEATRNEGPGSPTAAQLQDRLITNHGGDPRVDRILGRGEDIGFALDQENGITPEEEQRFLTNMSRDLESGKERGRAGLLVRSIMMRAKIEGEGRQASPALNAQIKQLETHFKIDKTSMNAEQRGRLQAIEDQAAFGAKRFKSAQQSKESVDVLLDDPNVTAYADFRRESDVVINQDRELKLLNARLTQQQASTNPRDREQVAITTRRIANAKKALQAEARTRLVRKLGPNVPGMEQGLKTELPQMRFAVIQARDDARRRGEDTTFYEEQLASLGRTETMFKGLVELGSNTPLPGFADNDPNTFTGSANVEENLLNPMTEALQGLRRGREQFANEQSRAQQIIGHARTSRASLDAETRGEAVDAEDRLRNARAFEINEKSKTAQLTNTIANEINALPANQRDTLEKRRAAFTDAQSRLGPGTGSGFDTVSTSFADVEAELAIQKDEKETVFSGPITTSDGKPGTGKFVRDDNSATGFSVVTVPNAAGGTTPLITEKTASTQINIGDKPLNPQQAVQLSALVTSVDEIGQVEQILFNDDGSVDRAALVTGSLGVPGTEGRRMDQIIENAIANKLRLETGAAANADEVEKIAKRFKPASFDSDESIRSKINRLRQFLQSAVNVADPSGNLQRRARGDSALSAEERFNQIQRQNPELSKTDIFGQLRREGFK